MWFDYLPDEEEQTAIVTHLSSFLKWLSKANPDFQKTLTREELTTCWLNEFEHPPFIQKKIDQMDIQFIAHCNEFLEANCEMPHLFEETFTPVMKPETQSEPNMPSAPKKGSISPRQFKFLTTLLKKRKWDIPIQQLSTREASQLIDELLEKKPFELVNELLNRKTS